MVLTNYRVYLRWIAFTLVLCAPVGPIALAQSSEGTRKVLTLEEAVDFALKNYPAVRASLERVTAAQAGAALVLLLQEAVDPTPLFWTAPWEAMQLLLS